MVIHDKVKAFLIAGVVFIAALVIVDATTGWDIVPDDTEKLFWSSLGPLFIGGVVAWLTREGHGPTK